MNMDKFKKITTLIIAIFTFAFIPLQSVNGGTFIDSARDKLGSAGQAANAPSAQSEKEGLGTLIGSAIRVVLQLVGVIFLVMMVYAGFLWMTSRGQEDKIEKARDIMTATVIGIFIVITAYAITVLVTGSIT